MSVQEDWHNFATMKLLNRLTQLPRFDFWT